MNIKAIIAGLILCVACQNSSTPSTNVSNEPAINVDSLTQMITGHFEPQNHPDFVIIDTIYADRPGMYLQKEAMDAFIKMWNTARSDGVDLVIRSATRNFNYQKGIWERKWNGKTLLEDQLDARTIADTKERALKILRYSSMPGTSRHHWGTDIDLNAFNNTYFESGEGLLIFNWLENNASNFGFCRPYTAFNELRTAGYQEEKWHWSYMPISIPMTQFAAQYLSDGDIQQFEGSDVATRIEVVKNYVLGVHPSCKEKQ